jgi:glycosyltransferase involved in cell wall biosynthesis
VVFRLAVFTTQIGAVSETFIRRHVEDLNPGATVAVARYSSRPQSGRWPAPCPVLFLDREASRLGPRLARRFGVTMEAQQQAKVAGFLRRHGIEVVLGEYLHQFVDFVPILDRLRIPYVAQGHGIDVSAALRQPGMPERYGAYSSARMILTRCEHHRRRLIDIGLPAGRIAVNPGGVDLPLQPPARGAGASKRLLAVGRMTAKKGPIYLLEAFRRAAAEDDALQLDYVGDGELAPAVRQFVDAMRLGTRVRLHGAAPEDVKQRLLRDCGVLVQHSLTDPETGDEEGLPAAIQEAMAHGLAVVSTRHSGIPEAIEDGVSGWLSEERDVDGMAQAILKASAEGVSARLGAAGRLKAEALYSWHSERDRLLSHLLRLD